MPVCMLTESDDFLKFLYLSVELIYLVFTRTPGGSYGRRFRSLVVSFER